MSDTESDRRVDVKLKKSATVEEIQAKTAAASRKGRDKQNCSEQRDGCGSTLKVKVIS